MSLHFQVYSDPCLRLQTQILPRSHSMHFTAVSSHPPFWYWFANLSSLRPSLVLALLETLQLWMGAIPLAFCRHPFLAICFSALRLLHQSESCHPSQKPRTGFLWRPTCLIRSLSGHCFLVPSAWASWLYLWRWTQIFWDSYSKSLMCSFYLRFISSMHLLELCQPTCSCCEWLVVLAVSNYQEPRLGFLGSRHWALYWDWGCPNFACAHLSSIFRSTAAALSPACPLCTCFEGHPGLQTHTKKWPNLNQGL